jgi:mRNA-degrading endonuclease toxin of MazEF toxin-antitoxin module
MMLFSAKLNTPKPKQKKTKRKLLIQNKTKTFDPNQNKQTKTKQKLLIRQDTADTRHAEQRDHRTHSRPRKHGRHSRHRRPRTDRKNRTRRKHRKRKPIPAANPTKTRSQVLCDNPSGGNEEKKRRSVIRSRNRANQGSLTSQCEVCLSIDPGGKDVRHRRKSKRKERERVVSNEVAKSLRKKRGISPDYPTPTFPNHVAHKPNNPQAPQPTSPSTHKPTLPKS